MNTIGGINVTNEVREPNDGIINTISIDGPVGRVDDSARNFAAGLNLVNP